MDVKVTIEITDTCNVKSVGMASSNDIDNAIFEDVTTEFDEVLRHVKQALIACGYSVDAVNEQITTD